MSYRELLNALADEVIEIERIGNLPVAEVTPDQEDYFFSHPLNELTGQQRRLIVANWLRQKAASLEG